MKKILLSIAASLGCVASLFAADVTVSGEISSNTTWSSDNIYTMTSKVWVTDGAILTIEAGTIIKAETKSNPSDAVALIVAQGGKIMAQGTAEAPIIFTSATDNLNYTTPSSLTASDKGLWGGIVLIGKAKVDIKDEVAGGLIEGVSSDEARGVYGVNINSNFDDADNSGVLEYVSIRHGGASVSADSELNGLSLYGVGSGTTINHIEVFANDDDGIEFFGGTVKVTHAIVTACSDDSFDWDQGFTGMGQFWLTIQDASSDKGFECDGGEGDLDPNSVPTIANFTLIGNGASVAVDLKKATGAKLYNGIITDYSNGIWLNSITESDVAFEGIVVNSDATDALYDADGTVASSQTFTINDVTKTMLTSIDGDYSGATTGADVTPSEVEAATSVATPAGLTPADYKGAFKPGGDWWACSWTRSWDLYIVDCEGDPAVGLDEDLASSLSLYPNPASSLINIASDNNVSAVEVLTLDGQVVLSSEVTTIDVDELQPGYYLLKAETSAGTITKSFVKQ